MPLAYRISIFSFFLIFAVICLAGAIGFGGPYAMHLWAGGIACGAGAVGVLLLKGPRPREHARSRVEGASEPTFRLVAARSRDEVWHLILGDSRFTLIRPDGSVGSTFDREWAVLAIQLPSFVRGTLLGIAKESWSPPARGGLLPIHEVMDEDATDFSWFSAPEELIREINDYIGRSRERIGAKAAGPLRIKAWRNIGTGAVGLAAGFGILLLAFANPWGRPRLDTDADQRMVAFGFLLVILGLWRLGRGIIDYREARRLSREDGSAASRPA